MGFDANRAHDDRYIAEDFLTALLSGWTGIDFSKFEPDQALQYVESNAIQSMVENLTTRRDVPMKIGDLAFLSPAGARMTPRDGLCRTCDPFLHLQGVTLRFTTSSRARNRT